MARIPYPALPASKPDSKGRPRPPPPNVSRLFAHSVATAPHWGAVANAHFTALQLDAKLRELAILLTTAKLGSVYEHTHHSRISGKLGVEEKQREWIREVVKNGGEGGVLSAVEALKGTEEEGLFTDKEKVLLVLVENVIERKDVGETLWKGSRGFFGEREMVEIVSLVGFYFTFSRITTVFEVELEGGEPGVKL